MKIPDQFFLCSVVNIHRTFGGLEKKVLKENRPMFGSQEKKGGRENKTRKETNEEWIMSLTQLIFLSVKWIVYKYPSFLIMFIVCKFRLIFIFRHNQLGEIFSKTISPPTKHEQRITKLAKLGQICGCVLLWFLMLSQTRDVVCLQSGVPKFPNLMGI